MPHFMDELEPVEGMHLNIDLSVWLRRLPPTVRLILSRVAIMWMMTVVGTLIAVLLPWGFRMLGIFVDLQLWLSLGLWFVLNGVGYVVCGTVFEKEDKHLNASEWDRRMRRAS